LRNVTGAPPDNKDEQECQPNIIPLAPADYDVDTFFDKPDKIQPVTSCRLSCSKKIIKLGLCVELFLQDQNPFVFEDVPDLAALIQKIPEFSCTDRACLYTGWITALPDPLNTKSALLHDAFIAWPVAEKMGVRIGIFGRQIRLSPIELAGPIRASCHASAASDTPVIVHDDDAIRFDPGRTNRATFDTGGIFALLTGHRKIKMSFVRDLFVIVIHVGVYKIDALLFFHFEDLDVVDLRITGLIVLLHTSVYTLAATDTSGDIEAVAE